VRLRSEPYCSDIKAGGYGKLNWDWAEALEIRSLTPPINDEFGGRAEAEARRGGNPYYNTGMIL